MKKIMGIDPGLAGGIALVNYTDRGSGFCKILYDEILAVPMPLTVRGKKKQLNLSEIGELINGVDFCFVEKVWGMPDLGAPSLCTCCRNYGMLIAILKLSGTDYAEIAPRTWQCKMLPKGYSNTKAASVAVCRAAVPGIDLLPGKKKKPHDGMADALCIALYGIKYWEVEKK